MVSAFIAIAAVLVFGTFAWVLRPLWTSRPLPVAIAIALLAVLTGLLYQLVGTPAAFDPAQREAPRTLEEAIQRLEQDLQRDPNQVEGLRLLGNAYLQTGQTGKASDAFIRATQLAPDDPDLLVEAAQARAVAAPERRFDDAAIALLRDALELQPMHQRGRWFLGIALRQRGEHAEAASTWEPLLDIVDANTASALRPQIDAARADAGLPPLEPADSAPDSPAALRIQVAIDPEVRARFDDNASVFVIARRPGGPPMPVAVEKHPLAALPDTVVLDDGDGPMPTQKLSQLQDVEVLARISASGSASLQEGDAESAPVRLTLPVERPVELRIP